MITLKAASENMLRIRVNEELHKHWMVDVCRIADEMAKFIPEATVDDIANELAAMVTASKGRAVRHHRRGLTDEERLDLRVPGSGDELGRVILFPVRTPSRKRQ